MRLALVVCLIGLLADSGILILIRLAGSSNLRLVFSLGLGEGLAFCRGVSERVGLDLRASGLGASLGADEALLCATSDFPRPRRLSAAAPAASPRAAAPTATLVAGPLEHFSPSEIEPFPHLRSRRRVAGVILMAETHWPRHPIDRGRLCTGYAALVLLALPKLLKYQDSGRCSLQMDRERCS